MKKYGKGVSIGLFLILGGFVLLQYQNCGNSSSSSNTSAVGLSGLTYIVTLTPSITSVPPNSPVNLNVNVQSSGSEQTYTVIGYVANGVKQGLCKVPSPGPSTNYTVTTCTPSFPSSLAGPVNLYVDILDPNFPPNEYMIECTSAYGPLVAGCAGTYSITVQ